MKHLATRFREALHRLFGNLFQPAALQTVPPMPGFGGHSAPRLKLVMPTPVKRSERVEIPEEPVVIDPRPVTAGQAYLEHWIALPD